MGAIIKHTKEDVKKFESEICSKCHCLNSCQSTFESMHEHIPNCPRFFNYMLSYTSFVAEQLERDRLHPEIAEARHQRGLEISKMIKSQGRKKKKA